MTHEPDLTRFTVTAPTRQIDEVQDGGDAARHAAGIDGTAGDAQDIQHRYQASRSGACLLCGLAESYRKHAATRQEASQ